MDYNNAGGMGVEYIGTFGISNLVGGIVYLSVGFEAIYPESKRDEIMHKIINSYESQLSLDNDTDVFPSSIKITNIYPNPSNNSMTISFSVLSQSSPIEITIRNIIGQEVYQTYYKPQSNNIDWTWHGIKKNGSIAPSGTYFISLNQLDQISTKKITLLK